MELLRYVEDYSIKHGNSPTYEEMRVHLGVASKSAVFDHVARLIERGFLVKGAGRTRSLKIIRPQGRDLIRIYDLGFRAGYAAALTEQN